MLTTESILNPDLFSFHLRNQSPVSDAQVNQIVKIADSPVLVLGILVNYQMSQELHVKHILKEADIYYKHTIFRRVAKKPNFAAVR